MSGPFGGGSFGRGAATAPAVSAAARPSPMHPLMSHAPRWLYERLAQPPRSGLPLGRSPIDFNRILQPDDTRLVHLVTGQLQLDPVGRRRQQWDPAAEEDRDDGDFHRVHQPRVREAAEELSATEE